MKPEIVTLLFGAEGQVGQAVARCIATMGPLHALSRKQCNLESKDDIREAIQTYRPNIIVNAAAYTAVDKAETDSLKCTAINSDAVRIIADESSRHEALLLHYSTDYVFDGYNNSPYCEDDQPRPLNVYGQTKLDAELAIKNSGCSHVILRTSWVYAVHGSNFLLTLLRLTSRRDTVRVVSDQVGAPTSAALIGRITVDVLRTIAIQSAEQRRRYDGLYHLAPTGETSWHAYALFILEVARYYGIPLRTPQSAVIAICSDEYPAVARRPSYSVLDTTKLRTTFDITLPAWQEGVAAAIKTIAREPSLLTKILHP